MSHMSAKDIAAEPAHESRGPAPLEARGVVTCYGRRKVLHGVSIDVRPGEIFGLIGLNGAGKTTLIKSIIDASPIREGAIRIFGRDHHDADSRRHLSFLPEQFLPSPYLKGWEFLELSLSYFGLSLHRPTAAALAERLTLDPAVLKKRVTTYSKGMGQKLGLVATLLSDRPLLILDEPMSGLDPRSRTRLKDALAEYRSRGRSVFLSSHILSDLDELCDSVAVIHDGRVLYRGTPGGLRTAYGNESLERAFLRAIETDESGSA
jgi:ABC-2 type transport system ATP-binding protein